MALLRNTHTTRRRSSKFPTNYDSMKMSNNIDQFWYVEKLTTLTQLYLELRLPLHDALRAAEADL
jgi:hypothetical protein